MTRTSAAASPSSFWRRATRSPRHPSGASALELLRTTKPDAIILDYALPHAADGAQFLSDKSKIAGAASIPVIVTTGFALPSQLEGAAAILTKPFDIDRLLELIRRFVPASTAKGEE
jgi:CheY-like chemotaxis protein